MIDRHSVARLMSSMILAGSLVGCAASGVTTPGISSSPGMTMPPTTAPLPSLAAADAPQFAFETDPVVTTALAGTTDRFVNPGAVIADGATLHMLANTFSAWPGHVFVPHLTPPDGITWTLDHGARTLDSRDFKLADPGIDVSTGYIANDGTWVLLYESVSPTSPWVVARMSGPGPVGPWTIEDAPILAPGPAGAFDAGGIAWPSVVRIGGRLAAYYTAVAPGASRAGSIGVAFSDDGTTWTKATAPVLTATESWEQGALDRPRVVVTPAGLVMLYSGLDLTVRGLATSTDGLNWTKVPGPNITRTDFPMKAGAWDNALLYQDGRLVELLEIGSSTTSVYRATLTWP
jgi:predicted GH43/DUF377 family glycosyl hydrolase